MDVRQLSPGDVEAVLAIQRGSPEAAQWSRTSYEEVVQGKLHGWIAERHGNVVGFLVARLGGDELEILNAGVERTMRRRGVGGRLLEEALAAGQQLGAQRAFLEMRASNHAALAFYERHGFARAGRRPRYYSEPQEDALVLFRGLL